MTESVYTLLQGLPRLFDPQVLVFPALNADAGTIGVGRLVKERGLPNPSVSTWVRHSTPGSLL